MFKKQVVSFLAKQTHLKEQEIQSLIEIPPDEKLGDYAFPCFVLAKKQKKAPNLIAEHLAKDIKLPAEIEKIEAKGPYLNFFVNKKLIAEQIIKINANYGKTAIGKKRKIVI